MSGFHKFFAYTDTCGFILQILSWFKHHHLKGDAQV